MRSFLRVLGVALFLGVAVAPLPAAGPRDQMVVSTAWLTQHLKDAGLVLLHVGDKGEYDDAHLPGARFVDLMSISAPMTSTATTPRPLSLELPATDVLRDRLAGFGISNTSTIVVYYGNDWYSPSTRVIWTLNYAGLGDRTKLLDGGMRAWVHDGHPTTTAVPAATTGTLSPLGTTNIVADAAFVTANKKTPGLAIVDARDREFYDGTRPAGQRGEPPALGHIPGAVSVPYASMFDAGGALLPADRLAAIFAGAGVKPGDDIVTYCHVGQQATAVWFAARTLGHEARMYDGSMNDWTQRGLPLEVPIKK